MKNNYSSLRYFVLTSSAVLALGAFSASARADVLFDENFDSSNYTNGGSIPNGTVINDGEWLAGGGDSTPTSPTLSSPRSLEMASGNIYGIFGGPGYVSPTTTGVDASFAFNLDSVGNNFVSLNDNTDTIRGIVSLGYYHNGEISAYFGDRGIVDLLTYTANTWYYADIITPTNPTATSTYTVDIYASDHSTLLASASGGFNGTPTDYDYLSFANNNPADPAYIDNVLVQTIPEPGTSALLVAALVGLAAFFRRKSFGNGALL